MKKIRIVAVSVVMAGLLLAVAGCEEQRLRAANRSLGERLDRSEAEKQQYKTESDQLSKQLEARNLAVAESEHRISTLTTANGNLTTALKKLKEMYDAETSKPRSIVINQLPPELNKALRDFAAANPKIADYDEKHGMVKFKSDLTFQPGSAVVNPQASETLTKLAKILNSANAKKFSIYVAGHTDDVPIGKPSTRRMHPTNWYLSAHRAVGVEKVLQKAGIAPNRIAVMGFGEYHPIAPNKPSKKGNKINRRVEIWIVPAGSFLTPPPKVEVKK